MKKVKSAEEIIGILRQMEVMVGSGKSIKESCRQLVLSEKTYYGWRKQYGGMKLDQAKRLKELEKENSRLRRVVADLTLDKAILKEAAAGN